MKDRVCSNCYYVGQPTTQGIGSFAVDTLIWMCFISLATLSSFFVLILIPLAWTTYHIAIYRKSTCPKCGQINMVSKKSRKGKRALKGPSVVVSYLAEEDKSDAVTTSSQRRNTDFNRQ